MNTGIVIIFYHPEHDRVKRSIDVCSRLGWPTVIIDNSPQAYDDAVSFPSNVDYLFLNGNKGIGAAQNRGIEYLLAHSVDTIVLLDQDTQLSEQWLSQLQQRFLIAKSLFPQLAALGPQVICEFDGQAVEPKIQKPIASHAGFNKVKQIIASGMMLDTGSLSAIGLMDESLFIDGVDHEWCWRATMLGYDVAKDTQTLMRHRQGDDRVRCLGLTFKVGSPIRLYYQFRNILLLIRRPYVPLYWKCRHSLALPLRWFVNRFFVAEGKARGRFMGKGLIDGLRGKVGPVDG